MRLFYYGKDGGEESHVWGYWLIELKRLFSVAILRFEAGSRDAYHSHAFNSISWVLSGELHEDFMDGKGHPIIPSWRPVFTYRSTFHRVSSIGTTWVLTFRGPWAATWKEYLSEERREVTLSNGRKEI